MSIAASDAVSLGFPFATREGSAGIDRGERRLRAKILQVLFTVPGERVNQPDFGCGLLDLVFEANDPILAASVEFSVGQALMRWLGDEIVVDRVEVEAQQDALSVDGVWGSRAERTRHAVRARFR